MLQFSLFADQPQLFSPPQPPLPENNFAVILGLETTIHYPAQNIILGDFLG